MRQQEREKILRARSIGPRMLGYFEAVGFASLEDFAGADADDVALRINVHLGRDHIYRHGVRAIANVIALANAASKGVAERG